MQNKNLVARRALQSSTRLAIFISLYLAPFTPQILAKSPFLDQPKFLKAQKKELTQSTSKEAECIRLSRGPGVDLIESNPGLHEMLTQVIEHLNNPKARGFEALFHPRAKVGTNFGDRVFSILRNRYDRPWNFSVYRVWALITPEKDRPALDCEGDEITLIHPRYGYDHQYAAWIQVMGQNELGRIFISIAPLKGQLRITGFHIQQWTHLEQDWEYWTRKGNEAIENNNNNKAFLAFDTAQKLLIGGDFVSFRIRNEIIKQRNLLFDSKNLLSSIQKAVDDKDIVYVGTLLNRDGTGLLLRKRLTEVPSTHDLQNLCQKWGRNLHKNKWLQGGGGVRCSFIVPGEPIDQEGQLGGFYYSLADLKLTQQSQD